VQQRLIALAVNLQLAGRLADTDPPAAKALLEEIDRDVQHALEEAAQLAQRIYPGLLEIGSLAAALRSAAASAGISASVEVTPDARCSPEVAATVYLCCLAALEQAAVGTRATLTVREEAGALAFEVVADGSGSAARLERLRDRVEALGGRLTLGSEPGRVAGSLPVSR
jgi:signal transduction histidine kinase